MAKTVYVLRYAHPLTRENGVLARKLLREHLGDPDAIVVVLGDGAELDVIHVPDGAAVAGSDDGAAASLQ